MDPSAFLAILLDVLKDEPAVSGLVRVWHIEEAKRRVDAAAKSAS